MNIPTTRSADTEKLKLPPQAVEAEQAVLGGLMLNNPLIDEVTSLVDAEDFYRNDHRVIFRAICALSLQNEPVDVVTVSEWLENTGELNTVGGLAYLGSLAQNTPNTANVSAYARIVRERAILRGLINAANTIAGQAYNPEGRSPGEVLDHAEQVIFDIAQRDEQKRAGFMPIKSLLKQTIDRVEELFSSNNSVTGVSTGFVDLDEMTSGLQRADLIVVAGRPSMGKCVAYDSELVMEDGAVVTIEEVMHKHRGRPVGTVSDSFKLESAIPSDYVDDGVKPVFEVTTRLGKRIETTLTHPFLTVSGWKPLAELKEGDVVAVPRQLPVFGKQTMRECDVKLLAYLIGDGGLTGNTARFTNSNPQIADEFRASVTDFGGLSLTVSEKRNGFAPSWSVVADSESVAVHRREFAARLDANLHSSAQTAQAVAHAVGVAPASVSNWRHARQVPSDQIFEKLCTVLQVKPSQLAPSGLSAARKNSRNPLANWLHQHGLMGKGAAHKTIPQAVFRLPRRQLAIFLNRLFATDGWATVLSSGQAQIGYASINETLVRQVQHLLLRFGVIASLRQRWVKYRDARHPSWQLDITHAESILTFAEEIGMFGKEASINAVAKAVAARKRQTNTDLLPVETWGLIEQAKGALSWSELARKAGVPGSNVHAWRRGLSRARLAKFALALGDLGLQALAKSDLYWDRIVSIVPAGNKQVYDLTVPGTHNFIANDVCVHNTSLAMNFVEHAAIEQDLPVAIFSMEMPGPQLSMRMLASLSRVNAQRLRTGKLKDDDWPRLTSTIAMLEEKKIFVDDTPALTPLELRTRARRLSREHGRLGLIVVDYLQLMQGNDDNENRATEISNITRSLKILAKELDVPLLALSQLNRSLETRPNKRPVMSDLRESGAIEQDADVIFFIYRDEVYNEDSPEKGLAEIIIGKQRNGPVGTIRLTFRGEFTRFENYASAEFEGAYR